MKKYQRVQVDAGNPVEGNVITITGSQTKFLVIEGGIAESRDNVRGDSYCAYVFKAIQLIHAGQPNPPIYAFSLKGGSMRVDGAQEVDSNDIELVEELRVTKKTVVTYVVD